MLTLKEGLSQRGSDYVLDDRVIDDELKGARRLELASEPEKCQLRIKTLKLNSTVISDSSSYNSVAILAAGNLASVTQIDFNQIDLSPKIDYFDSGRTALTFKVTPQFCQVLFPNKYESVKKKIFDRFDNLYSVYGPPGPEQDEFYLEYLLTEPSLVFDIRSAPLPGGGYAYKDAKIRKSNARRLSTEYVNNKYRTMLTQDVDLLLRRLDEQEYVKSQCGSLGFGVTLRNDLLIIGVRGTDSVNQAVDQLKRVTAAGRYLTQKFACGAKPAAQKPY